MSALDGDRLREAVADEVGSSIAAGRPRPQLSQLYEVMQQLAPEEREIVRRLRAVVLDEGEVLYRARRLLSGQRGDYGPLNLAADDRDFDEEIHQEQADIDNYRAMRELRADIRAGRWKP